MNKFTAVIQMMYEMIIFQVISSAIWEATKEASGRLVAGDVTNYTYNP